MTGPNVDYAMLGKSLGTLKRNVINDLNRYSLDKKTHGG